MEFTEKMILVPFSLDKNEELRSIIKDSIDIKEFDLLIEKNVIKKNEKNSKNEIKSEPHLYTNISPSKLRTNKKKKTVWLI